FTHDLGIIGQQTIKALSTLLSQERKGRFLLRVFIDAHRDARYPILCKSAVQFDEASKFLFARYAIACPKTHHDYVAIQFLDHVMQLIGSDELHVDPLDIRSRWKHRRRDSMLMRTINRVSRPCSECE